MSSEITRGQNRQYDLYKLILGQIAILANNIEGEMPVGGGAGFKTVSFIGDNVATEFVMPDDTNINGDFFTSESYSVTLSLISGVKTATFSIAPTDEQHPIIIYTPTVIPASTNKDVYHPVLTQVGEADPTVVIFESTISGIVVTRSAVGTTLFTKVGSFPTGKCSPANATVGYTLAGDKLVLTPVSEDVYKLETYAAVDTEVLADGVLVNQEVIIEIYKI